MSKTRRLPEIDIARSRQMALVKSKDTKPELLVRKLVFSLGARFRLHRRDLPGRPDLTLSKRKKVIFVHGCFWHRHGDPRCKLARMPKSRVDFWNAKLSKNAERDNRDVQALLALGWEVLLVWECETSASRRGELTERLRLFLAG